jgi:hypothetical protein
MAPSRLTVSGLPSPAAIVVEVTMEEGVVLFFAFARAAGWSSWARWGDAASARVT